MVRSYRKYEATHTFATVYTPTSNVVWTPSPNSSASSGRAFVPANSEVLHWDIKTSALLSRFHDSDNRSNAEVTALTQCAAQPDLIAAGYGDGSIRVWDTLTGLVVVRFDGHRSAVTVLKFDAVGERIVSGSKDTDIIVWDLLAEKALFRLRGHKDQITGLALLRTSGDDVQTDENYLLSVSKDALVKVWDLENPHCIETHAAQTNGECWALGLSPEGDGCITAGNDGELKVWRIDLETLASLDSSSQDGTSKRPEILISQGVLRRQGKDRTIGVSFHSKQDYISIHGSEKSVEIWRIRGAEELHRHMQRKRRRRREKAAAAGETLQPEPEESVDTPDVTDVFVPYVIVRTGGKVRSVDWMLTRHSKKELQLLVASTNNQLETYNITTQPSTKSTRDSPEYSRALSLDSPGHRTDIRTLALSSDDRMLASASNGQLKLWNTKTRSCFRTMECGQGLCSAFLPGDRIVLLGTKGGEVEVWDISTSTLIETVPAHEGAVWAMAVQPDGKALVTGGADKTTRFWRFDIVDEEIPGTRRTTQRLKLTRTRELKLSDDILAVGFSPDERLLALSTLDNTVKIFFVDSLKLFLTLYGHKLPVLDLSISSDSKLIATCSADKNVRIWGLDFGDCHKAFFAHNDSVMAVRFIPHPLENDERHILFSASKDGVVKSWDGDKFEQIQRLEGHKGEVWALAVGRTGEMVVTASHDKSIRFWEVGDDLVFLEEERERELEEMYESTLALNFDRDAEMEDGDGGQDDVANTTKQTIATLTHGEKVMEALEQGIEDLQLMRAYERDKQRNPKMAVPQRNPIFLALGNVSAEEYVLSSLQKIPTPALNDALLVIPFTMLPTLFTFLALFLQKRMQPDLTWRVTYFLLQVHMKQIVASKQLRDYLERILEAYEGWQAEEKKVVGFNLAGLSLMGKEAREREVGERFVGGDESDDAVEMEKGRRKRGFASLA